jgi:tetratricopeptide (TPR) repeat protein
MSPKRRRITKHMMKEDKLVTATFQLSEWIQKNTKKILRVAGVIVAVGIVIFIIISTRARRNEKSYQLLSQATLEFRVGQLNQAVSNLETVVNQYAGTKAASQATFLLANIYFYNGQLDQAISTFEKFKDKYKDDPLLLASSLSGIAQCYLEKREFMRAGAFFSQAFESDSQGVLAANYLLSSGFSYSQGKDLEKAKSSYQKIVEFFPNSQEAVKAKKELAEIDYSYVDK